MEFDVPVHAPLVSDRPDEAQYVQAAHEMAPSRENNRSRLYEVESPLRQVV